MDEQKRGGESDYGAFIQKFQLQPPPFPSSNEPLSLPLQGLAFAVKDTFDISGYVTGFGSPDWARTHAAATATAPVVSALLNAGATCVGKAIMDELAFSVNGENKHYGTPVNPCAPDRAPGGSSSGSAVAVAAKLVDFSLGTDTGGSVRVPAAYCGILGFRPSHGIISTSGVIPFAQSFDTVGWFARDPSILTKVGRVLLQSPFDVTTEPTHITVPEDCFQHLGSPNDGVSDILINSVQKIFGSVFINQENFGDYLSHRVPSLNSFMSEVSDNDANIIPALSALSSANTILQRFEFKSNHDEWLNKVKADFGPGVISRLSLISEETFENIDIYQTLRVELQTAMDALLEDFGVLAIPTVTGPPPELQMKTQTLGDFRAHALRLVCIAGLSGICQVTIPLGMRDNLPVSISLLASKGNDPFLLKLAETLYATLREEAATAWELDIEASK